MKRSPKATMALFAALTTVVSTGCTQRPSPVERIVLVTIDTLRWDHVGYMGHDVATPNIDRLARSGTVFTQAIASAPVTLPSHASILSGMYPQSHGARANGFFRLSDDIETVAEVLNQAGFATGAFVGAFVLDRRFGLEQGFDHYDDDLPDENPVHQHHYAERRAEEVVGRATDWVESHREEPFFLWVHVFDPHAPYDPPPPYKERYPDRPYVGEIAYTDAALGPLIDTVTSIDDGKGTAIVITSDHGESLGEHGESTHALFIYDATMRVPLILHGPGIPEGIKVDKPVRTVDLAPTLLELAGQTFGKPLDGVSLLDSLQSGETPTLNAYGETFVPRFNYNWSELRFLRTDGFKFIDAPNRELYDLKADPEEQVNLWSENPPEVGERLLSKLQEIIAVSEDDDPAPSIELDEEAVRRLESLGYVGTTLASSRGPKDRPDPKDRIEVYERLQKLLASELPAKQLIEEYQKVIALEPANAMARIGLANTLVKEGRLEEAVKEYRSLLGVIEIDSKELEELAVALLLSNRVEEALEVTEQAVEKKPWDLDLHVLRGEALEKAGRLEEAMETYRRVIELRPDDPEYYWRYGAIASLQGNKDLAERNLREALEKDAHFQPALTSLSRLLTEDGRIEEALQLLSQSGGEESGRDRTESNAALAEVYLSAGRYDDARTRLEEAKADNPESSRVWALLGLVYGRSGELQRAEDAFRKALSLGEASPEVRRNLAVVYLQQGKLDASIAELQSAVREAPENPQVLYTLGNAYFRANDPRRSAAAFERALELRPAWPEAVFNMALAYEHANQPQKAVEAYRRYLTIAGVSDGERRAEAERRLALLER